MLIEVGADVCLTSSDKSALSIALMNGDFNEYTLEYCLLLIEYGAHSKVEMTLACMSDHRVPVRMVSELLHRGCTLDEMYWDSVVDSGKPTLLQHTPLYFLAYLEAHLVEELASLDSSDARSRIIDLPNIVEAEKVHFFVHDRLCEFSHCPFNLIPDAIQLYLFGGFPIGHPLSSLYPQRVGGGALELSYVDCTYTWYLTACFEKESTWFKCVLYCFFKFFPVDFRRDSSY